MVAGLEELRLAGDVRLAYEVVNPADPADAWRSGGCSAR